MQWTGQKAMFDLRRQLMAHLQTLDVAYFDRNPVGRLVPRVTTDVDVLNDLFASGLVTIIGDILMLSFVVAAMFRLSPGMTGLMLAVMPAVVLVTVRFREGRGSDLAGGLATAAIDWERGHIRHAVFRFPERPQGFLQPEPQRADNPGCHDGHASPVWRPG